MKVLGIDEAGRGSLVGPLVVGFVILDTSKKLSFDLKDSKDLTPKEREEIYEKLKEEAEYIGYEFITPEEIDRNSMNFLEYKYIKKHIEKLEFDALYIDAFMDPIYFKNLHKYVIAEYKADSKYSVVSAASIVAKVERDKYINQLKEKVGDFGSGYPSDPRTINFLSNQENFSKLKPYLRKKWSTYKNITFKRLKLDF